MNLSWDERWQQKKDETTPPADTWLIKQKKHFSKGTALDLACGRGRNSLFLAENGYQVTGIDSSSTALELLLASASAKNLNIEVQQHNLETGLPSLPDQFDLLLSFYFLQRNLFPHMQASIAPRGLFIGRSFCQTSTSGAVNDIIYEPGELIELFSGWDILEYEEGIEMSQRGGTLAGIVARKPFS